MANNSRHITYMTVCSILGGVIGGLAGMYWLQPQTLIPIGVVVGLSIGLALGRRR
ncbi:hypothetical protein [Herbidospora cretacea]|uniref:hypothetical protein n=1 Tax=Herbidospora cretacea TaxID=28444 RepID=UPI000A58C33D|nr:hypothetical protein [Herbidospora cretacea]